MSYYMGDYYQGDYYRGDPGLFSFVGKALGGIAKVGVGLVKGFAGIPSAPQVPLSLTSVPTFQLPTQLPTPPRIDVPQGTPGATPTPGIGGVLSRILPGGMSGYSLGAGCTIKGTHNNRSTYVTRGGGTSRWPQSVQVHPKGTECVKNRRMNVANPRALRRALRRAYGFEKLAMRTIRLIHPKKKASFGGFKKRRRSK